MEIGERIASLEAEFKSFKHETLKDNTYIRDKLDVIIGLLPQKVDRSYCQTRHEKQDDRINEVEKNGKYEKLIERVRELEQRTPAIIQQIGVAIITVVLTAAAMSRIP